MRRRRRLATCIAAACAAVGLTTGGAWAETELFFDFDEWEAAVGEYTMIDFTGFENGETLSDQYEDLGVTSPVGSAFFRRQTNIFPSDWWGVSSLVEPGINFAFDTPQRWIAADFPGAIAFRLYSDDVFIEEVQVLAGGIGNFGGIISETAFDRVEIIDFINQSVSVDNVYFGVPAPGALSLLGVGVLTGGRRRRAS